MKGSQASLNEFYSIRLHVIQGHRDHVLHVCKNTTFLDYWPNETTLYWSSKNHCSSECRSVRFIRCTYTDTRVYLYTCINTVRIHFILLITKQTQLFHISRREYKRRETKFWLVLIKPETSSCPITFPSAFSFSVNAQYYIHELPDCAHSIPHYIRVEECEKPITNNQFIVWVHTQIPQNFLPF